MCRKEEETREHNSGRAPPSPTPTHTVKPSDSGLPRNYAEMWHKGGGEGVKAMTILKD